MISVHTSKPVALDSPDHLVPRGTMNDNSVHPAFNCLLYDLIPPHQIRLLDLGCAGGGFVKSILDDGGFAVGIEGSDYSKIRGRAEWATIPDHLFTADITELFEIRVQESYPLGGGNLHHGTTRMNFNVITAWEFFEHIAPTRLDGVMENIERHLDPDGYLVGSISPAHDYNFGIALHQTVQERPWWEAFFRHHGFEPCPKLESHFGDDWIRGPKSAQPVPLSFLIVLRPMKGAS